MINSAMTALFSAVFAPFRGLHPMWAMAFVSLLAGVIMLWIFGKVSNQKAIKSIRSRISGNLIGVRLFQSDTGTVFRLQGKILWDTAVYMKHSLMPMVIMMPPVLLIMIQLNLNFASRPLKEGEQAMVKIKVREAKTLDNDVTLTAPDGVTVETPAVRIASENEAAWRIRVDKSGDYSLKVKIGDEEVEKLLRAGEAWTSVPSIRTGKNALDLLLWPGENPLPASGAIESIEIRYPSMPMTVMGYSINWLVAFFVLSIIFGFAFKDLLGVQI